VKEHPILFNGEMVRAILEGRKTQTRRVILPQPTKQDGKTWLALIGDNAYMYSGQKPNGEFWQMPIFKCPYGQPGDRLWVRETWREVGSAMMSDDSIPKLKCDVRYCADDPLDGPWRPSIHMPRWASRITLEVVAVRVEKIQDITPNDCRAEGMPATNTDIGARYAFGMLWNIINASRGYGWDANPFVWVVEFKVVERAGL
jgi:hypothetical protein